MKQSPYGTYIRTQKRQSRWIFPYYHGQINAKTLSVRWLIASVSCLSCKYSFQRETLFIPPIIVEKYVITIKILCMIKENSNQFTFLWLDFLGGR